MTRLSPGPHSRTKKKKNGQILKYKLSYPTHIEEKLNARL